MNFTGDNINILTNLVKDDIETKIKQIEDKLLNCDEFKDVKEFITKLLKDDNYGTKIKEYFSSRNCSDKIRLFYCCVISDIDLFQRHYINATEQLIGDDCYKTNTGNNWLHIALSLSHIDLIRIYFNNHWDLDENLKNRNTWFYNPLKYMKNKNNVSVYDTIKNIPESKKYIDDVDTFIQRYKYTGMTRNTIEKIKLS